ncbi:MAG: Gfo/Idh/MocA family oxidoreductase [Armatimonadota bacterium]|nr:MAG: Gfo/Idh/MocA family oxidoreductase [Armatimonadota bacterium]
MVKLGFLGCGFMGQGVHLPNFLASDRCQVVALAEARTRLGQAVAAKHGIPRVYSSHRELAGDPEIAAVAAISSEAFHRGLVGELLAAGKHVYTEKPLATTVADAQALVEAAARSNRILMTAYMKRYDTGIRRAKELMEHLVADGDLGRVTYARGHCFGGDWIAAFKPTLLTTDERPPTAERTTPPWLPDELKDAYLTYVNVYCHNINLLRWFLACQPAVKHAEHRSGVTVVVMDFAGIPAVLETGSLPAHRWDEGMTVYFERGRLRIFPPPPLHPEPARVILYRAGDAREVVEPLAPWRWSFAAEAEHFLECVEANQQPLTPGADALQDLEVCEAVFQNLVAG